MSSQCLSSLQKKSLTNCDFSSSFLKLFDPPSPSDIDPFDEFQSLSNFIEIGKRPPNEKGTGRNIIDAKRKTLYVTRIVSDYKMNDIYFVLFYPLKKTCNQIQKRNQKQNKEARPNGKKIKKSF